MRMKRVLVIGSSGAGKSTFSRRLGEKTGLEVIHLDKLHWKPNWTEPPKDEWQKTVAEALKSDSWIMDGNYSATIEMRIRAADTVVFLDFPRLLCVYRILKRVFLSYGKTRPDMAEDCKEQFDWVFVKWVWNFPNRSKPRVERLLEQYGNEKTVIRLKSRREVEDFFANDFSDTVKSF
jgi:adenylate kinase family enzyme